MRSLALLALLLLSDTSVLAQPSGTAAATFERVDCSALTLSGEGLDEGVECARLTVPETRGSDGSPSLVLPVIVLRASGPEWREDPILYLHGGPGIATLDMLPRVLQAPSWLRLRRERDIILFDQRGSGRSTPSLCPDFDAEMNRLASEAPAPEVEQSRRIEAARACRAALLGRGSNPASYNSTAIAQDAEDVRRALGYERWNLWPTSFGTLPAIELVRRYPGTVRSLILNSAFPPNSPNRAEQIGALAEALAALQRRCNREAACRERHPNIRSLIGRTAARLNAAPLTAPEGRVTGAVFLRAIWTLLVRGRTAVMVPEFVRRAAAGEDALILKVAGPFSRPDTFGDYSHAQAWLVNCHDVFPRPSEPLIRAAQEANPDLVTDFETAEQDLVCAALQPDHAPANFYAATASNVPALIFFGEFDPATPRGDANAALALLPRSLLIDVAGASHAPMGTDECTLGIAADFLADPAATPDAACLQSRAVATIADAARFDSLLSSMP